MAGKAKQKIKQFLKNFTRGWNANQAPVDKKRQTYNILGSGPSNGNKEKTSKPTKMRRYLGILILLICLCAAGIVYIEWEKYKEKQLAQEQQEQVINPADTVKTPAPGNVMMTKKKK